MRDQEREAARQHKEYEDRVAETKRVQFTPEGWKTVTTRTFTVIQNTKSGRKAAIIHISRLGRHYYVQPLLKDMSIGASKPHWTRVMNWQSVGKVELPFIEGPASEPERA